MVMVGIAKYTHQYGKIYQIVPDCAGFISHLKFFQCENFEAQKSESDFVAYINLGNCVETL